MKLAFVVPTRHRAALAITAIQSTLSQPVDLSVIVSDNSSSQDEARQLEEFCGSCNDPRLLYVRSSPVRPMPAHWDWALEQALARTDATHFGVQYDRKIWKPGQLQHLAAACASAPGTLVSYVSDFTYPAPSASGAWQAPATGKLYEVRTSSVIGMTARGMIYEMGQNFPVLSNCMVPRGIMDTIRDRFGDFCNSSTPDAAFAFRFCAIEATYRHLDRALAIIYAFKYSNGLSLFRRDSGGTWDDFTKLWGERMWLPEAPIPGLDLGQNILFHEYNVVRRATGEARFPPIDHAGYLRELARALPFIQDPAHKSEMRALLESHGWIEDPPRRRPLYLRVLDRVRHPRGFREHLFGTDEEALAYLLNNPLPLSSRKPLLAPLDPVEVPFAPLLSPHPVSAE
jgi:hypothetical protein